MNNLKWGQVTQVDQNFEIAVTVGKNVERKGIRRIRVGGEIKPALDRIRKRNPQICKDDYIFMMSDGSVSNELSKNFTKLLEYIELKVGSDGIERTLYSTRHTFVTDRLRQNVSLAILASHCGTSPEMIHQFYSHLVPSMHVDELVNNISPVAVDPLEILKSESLLSPLQIAKLYSGRSV